MKSDYPQKMFDEMVKIAKEYEENIKILYPFEPKYIKSLDEALEFLSEQVLLTPNLEMNEEKYDKYIDAFNILIDKPSP